MNTPFNLSNKIIYLGLILLVIACNQYHFIIDKLLPVVHSTYKAEANQILLPDNSFGTYFSLSALLKQVKNNRDDLKDFVSAGPFFWNSKNNLFQFNVELKILARKDTQSMLLIVDAGEVQKLRIYLNN